MLLNVYLNVVYPKQTLGIYHIQITKSMISLQSLLLKDCFKGNMRFLRKTTKR